MNFELNRATTQALKTRAHKLKPVVLIGKDGLTDALHAAVDAALNTHELIKVKLLQSVDMDKNEAAAQLSARAGAALIQRVGKTVVLYRPRPEEDE